MFGRKVDLKWNGETYTLKTTFEIASMIDEEIGILKTAIDIDGGVTPKITVVAKLYSILLRYAGADVTSSEIYESILTSGFDSKGLISSARFALNCLFPETEEGDRVHGKKSSGAKKKT